jgi:hypothetical protein
MLFCSLFHGPSPLSIPQVTSVMMKEPCHANRHHHGLMPSFVFVLDSFAFLWLAAWVNTTPLWALTIHCQWARKVGNVSKPQDTRCCNNCHLQWWSGNLLQQWQLQDFSEESYSLRCSLVRNSQRFFCMIPSVSVFNRSSVVLEECVHVPFCIGTTISHTYVLANSFNND